MAPPNEETERERWRGKVDALLETQGKRLDAVFELLEAAKQKLEASIDRIEKDVQKVSQDLSNFSAKATVIIALGAFLGTAATSLLVTAVVKIMTR